MPTTLTRAQYYRFAQLYYFVIIILGLKQVESDVAEFRMKLAPTPAFCRKGSDTPSLKNILILCLHIIQSNVMFAPWLAIQLVGIYRSCIIKLYCAYM